MRKIDSLTIKPLTSGFLMDVQFDGSDDPAEHAYSDFEDLANALALLLGPVLQIVTSAIRLLNPDGSSADPDDGWREWDSHLRPGQEYPPGVKSGDVVEYRLRSAKRRCAPVQASVLRWFWAGDSEYDPDSDIIAYRMVKP